MSAGPMVDFSDGNLILTLANGLRSWDQREAIHAITCNHPKRSHIITRWRCKIFPQKLRVNNNRNSLCQNNHHYRTILSIKINCFIKQNSAFKRTIVEMTYIDKIPGTASEIDRPDVNYRWRPL